MKGIVSVSIETASGLQVMLFQEPLNVLEGEYLATGTYRGVIVVHHLDSDGNVQKEYRQCETIGCTNPALDRMTQIAPATNIRVCGECAAKFQQE